MFIKGDLWLLCFLSLFFSDLCNKECLARFVVRAVNGREDIEGGGLLWGKIGKALTLFSASLEWF